jgi:acetyltransferase-like isoleucine patch superfamily enzyme
MSQMGTHTYVGAGTELREFEGHITIGDYCSIADCVTIFGGGEHRSDKVSTYPFDAKMGLGTATSFSRGDVVIGSDVWIGTRAIILPGVTISHGAVIGAGAVVTHDVPPYAVFVGVPAGYIRFRFDTNTVNRLLAVAWWDWPEEKVREFVPLMDDIEAFLEAAEKR